MEHCHTVLSFTLVSSVLAGVEIEGASETSAASSLVQHQVLIVYPSMHMNLLAAFL